MTQIYVKYNPYRLETILRVNGKTVPADNNLSIITNGKRLQEWIGDFPRLLRDELCTADFSVEFCGMALDWDDFEYVFRQAEENGIVKIHWIKFVECEDDDTINDKIVSIFRELRDGPIDDFRDPKLLKAFEIANNAVFPVNVVATMSSGKSTLINALLRRKLMPSKNEACTATITEILDNDDPHFKAIAYNSDNQVLRVIPELTLEQMHELNENAQVHRISAEGNIPFLDAHSMALMLVDTPGPNNARNQAHKNMTYRSINNDSNNLILYVLNGTQLAVNDDSELLHYVADQISKGGKQVRDRFLFVINKMDEYDPEEEDVDKAILAAKRYLSSHGIDDPQLFPCSAFAALNIRTDLKGVDIENLTRAQRRHLSSAANSALPMIEKSLDFESMHLEKYSTLSPSAQQELDFRLSQANDCDDLLEQALIHSGIASIEAAITTYVKKYAKTKKIKDLTESFHEVLKSNEILAKAKTQVAQDKDAAKACAERAAAVRQKIADGKEAEAFQKKIDSLNPMPAIAKKAKLLKQKATSSSSKVFRLYGDIITNREEAMRLVNQFSLMGFDTMAELTSELESVINREIVQTGNRLLMEYQEKLFRFDNTSSAGKLDFGSVDLIRGKLNTMRENAESWTTDDFVTGTVDELGTTTYEEKINHKLAGTKEEKVLIGHHQEKIGTKEVLVGTHREKTGTRMVVNPEKRWWKILTPKYIEEDVYKIVNDYKTEDIFKTVPDYETVIRNIYIDEKETIEKFSVSTASIQQTLIARMRLNLDNGINGALTHAETQVKQMKKQFAALFSELDQLIASKYAELENCALDQAEKEATLATNQHNLNWIEQKMAEIDSILDME